MRALLALTNVRPLQSLGVASASLLVPTAAQKRHAVRRWEDRMPTVAFGLAYVLPEEPTAQHIERAVRAATGWEDGEIPAGGGLTDCIIVDFVGHAPSVADALRQALRRIASGQAERYRMPAVLDVGAVAISQCAALLRRAGGGRLEGSVFSHTFCVQ